MGYFGPGLGTTAYGQINSSALLVFVFILICRRKKISQGQDEKVWSRLLEFIECRYIFSCFSQGDGKC